MNGQCWRALSGQKYFAVPDVAKQSSAHLRLKFVRKQVKENSGRPAGCFILKLNLTQQVSSYGNYLPADTMRQREPTTREETLTQQSFLKSEVKNGKKTNYRAFIYMNAH
ncbi:hypothetical protein AB6A40_010408 [Gnathostoma spinigerum]|uniref:Uncharacterized protein n=1 Tax=Gnathostoma spinigerum TaxID=75299 RepID=A0ABD6EUQ4_9BILA